MLEILKFRAGTGLDVGVKKILLETVTTVVKREIGLKGLEVEVDTMVGKVVGEKVVRRVVETGRMGAR